MAEINKFIHSFKHLPQGRTGHFKWPGRFGKKGARNHIQATSLS